MRLVILKMLLLILEDANKLTSLMLLIISISEKRSSRMKIATQNIICVDWKGPDDENHWTDVRPY